MPVVNASFVSRFEEVVHSVHGIENRNISDSQPKIPKEKSFVQDGGEGEAE
jgi:hypothetical protein